MYIKLFVSAALFYIVSPANLFISHVEKLHFSIYTLIQQHSTVQRLSITDLCNLNVHQYMLYLYDNKQFMSINI